VSGLIHCYTGMLHGEPVTIRTSHVNPPIPTRDMDWCAWIDGREESGMYGHGATEAAALHHLAEQMEEEGA